MFFIDEHLSAIFNIVPSTEQYKHKCFYLWIVLICIFSPLVDYKTHKVTEHTKLTGQDTHVIRFDIYSIENGTCFTI